MPESDESLMKQIALGSHPHLETLIRRHAQSVFTFATRYLGSVQRGEEAFQDTILALWARRSSYRCPDNFRPWLFRIALNKCRQLLRPSDALTRENAADPDHLDTSHAPSPSTSPLETALALLPDQQRAILILRLWNGMSCAEIAETLNLSECTIPSAIHNALANLHRHLDPGLSV
jgi:RNA polymerase sigma-70 factor (ECF subfamily)